MEEWPEFVTEKADGSRDTRRPSTCLLTGWEDVIFILEDDYGLESSTAALAP
jgi:hypothetical protein